MRTSPSSPTSLRASRPARHRIARSAAVVVAGLGLLASSPRTSLAQSAAPAPSAWELRFTSGALIPTGSQRNALKDAQLSAAQLSWLVRPSFAITGTFGWARSRDLTALDTPKLDVFAYDLGMEARRPEWFTGRTVTFSPFVGAGVGARSYNYRSLDVDATNNMAAYGAAGGELGVRRVGVRLEVRDYATGFRPLVGAGKSETRNDVILMVGLRLKKQPASRD